ncbi:MAG TPA: zinc ribbon domain-containing protein [Polyangia bacterium]|nr:zinc ribbon domain-containing protein [Polyangia bacterium]
MKEQTLPADAGAPSAAPSAPARRRVPAIVLGLGGAAVAAVYGVTVMHMRMGAPLVMLALGGLTLVLSGIALWRVLDPLSRDGVDVASPTAPRASGRLRELEREKQLVLKAIKEVEVDYQMRKIAEPDYKDMVERYRTRALRIIGELEAGDNFRPLIERELRDRLAVAESAKAAAADAPPSVGVCPSCSTRNDEDAQFCKKCGGTLAGS